MGWRLPSDFGSAFNFALGWEVLKFRVSVPSAVMGEELGSSGVEEQRGKRRLALGGKWGDQAPRTIGEQVSRVTGARKHMVGIGLIPLSSLVTEGALVLERAALQARELLRISPMLLGVIRTMCSSESRGVAKQLRGGCSWRAGSKDAGVPPPGSHGPAQGS